MTSNDKMESLLKLTDDIVSAAGGIAEHITSVLDGIFERDHGNTNTDSRKPNESDNEDDRERSAIATAVPGSPVFDNIP